MDEGVSADEEVGQDSPSRASCQAVGAVDPTGHDGHLAIVWNQADAQAVQSVRGQSRILVSSGHFRPDRRRRDECSVGSGTAEGGGRATAVLTAAGEEVQDDARIDGGDHRPRARSMYSSTG